MDYDRPARNGDVLENEIKAPLEISKTLVKIVEDWISDNSDAIRENGGSGDVQQLLALLWDSWKNDS